MIFQEQSTGNEEEVSAFTIDFDFKDLFPCLLRVIIGQGNRKPSGLTMTQNTGRG